MMTGKRLEYGKRIGKNRHNGGNNNNHSKNIMYQSRMRILKSREGSGRRSKLGEKIISENSFSSSFVDRGTRKPCSAEKLLPPMQLMTKQQTFRHLYLKYHPPKVQVRVDFLTKKEDPILVKKREQIFAKIRASEKASERLKREKERGRAAEPKLSLKNDGGAGGVGAGGAMVVNSLSESSGNDESQQDVNGSDFSNGQKDGGLFAEESSVVVSGFITDSSKKSGGSLETSLLSANSNGNSNEDMNDEESFGDSFAFLLDWKKEKKKR